MAGWGVAVAVLAVAWLALGALTAAGSRRRGRGLGLATLAGLFFPVTWVMWYLADHHRAGPRAIRRAP